MFHSSMRTTVARFSSMNIDGTPLRGSPEDTKGLYPPGQGSDYIIGIDFYTILDNLFTSGYVPRQISRDIPKYNIMMPLMPAELGKFTFNLDKIGITFSNIVDRGILIFPTKNPNIVFALSGNALYLPTMNLSICRFVKEKYKMVPNYSSVYIALARMVETYRDFTIANNLGIIGYISLLELCELASKEMYHCCNFLIKKLEILYEYIISMEMINETPIDKVIVYKHTTGKMYFEKDGREEFENCNTFECEERFKYGRAVFSKMNASIRIEYDFNNKISNCVENVLLRSNDQEKEEIVNRLFKDLYIKVKFIPKDDNIIIVKFSKKNKFEVNPVYLVQFEQKWNSINGSETHENSGIIFMSSIYGYFDTSVDMISKIQNKWIAYIEKSTVTYSKYNGRRKDEDEPRQKMNKLIGPLEFVLRLRTEDNRTTPTIKFESIRT